MEYCCVYILLNQYSNYEVNLFRKNYLKDLIESSSYYEYPPFQGANEFETDSIDELISFLIEKKGYYRIYFTAPDQFEVLNGMIFFNKDSTITFGLEVECTSINKFKEKLTRDFNSDLILFLNEIAPPNNLQDFKSMIQ